MGGADAFEAMRRACDELVDQMGEPRPPIKLAPLARVLGAKLSYTPVDPLGREEASIRFEGGELVLWVSRSKFENFRTRRRARFSIAHEIGHLLMFRMLGSEFLDHSEGSDDSYELTERLCDFAGSQILLPRRTLLAALQQRSFSTAGLRSLEELFDVSSPALLRAIADLVPDGAVIELRKFRRRPSEPLTWRVWNVSTGLNSNYDGSWLPVGCTLKHILGLQVPETLPIDVPVFHPELRLMKGRAVRFRDAIATRIALPSIANVERLDREENRLGARNLSLDGPSGRLMLLVGKVGSLMTVQPSKGPA
jgi:hypothetical protein